MKRTNRVTGMAAALAGAIIGLGALAAPATADVLVRHAKGELSLPSTPEKVFVFDLASLDTLTALGVEVSGVPGGKKPAYLSQYEGEDVAKIGTLFEPDYEAINAGEPDLIIVAGRSSAKYEDLAKLAPTIDLTTDTENFLESARQNARTLAGLFGKEEEAEALLAKLDESNAALGREGDAASKFLDNEIVAQTTAWKEGNVVYLDAAAWYLVGGGLTAMQKTVDQLTEAFDKK